MSMFKRFLDRFRNSESGSATMEFVMVFPIFMVLMGSAWELGVITMRTTTIERATDLVVRDIRLGTGTAPQHDEIKQRICDLAPILRNCDTNLRVELLQLDPRNWAEPPTYADCTDTSQPVSPVRSFENGQENELMLMRVCFKVDPVFPAVGLGHRLVTDASGKFALVASAAFVQEPL
ncbi:MAG: TadE family protein [Thalassovita sp.]|nr:TadE family protein [Thalassovita sp.]